jgi:hypothetical protein
MAKREKEHDGHGYEGKYRRKAKRVSAIDAAGLAAGVYFSSVENVGGIDVVTSNPGMAAVGLFSGVTGYNFESRQWNMDNLAPFWVPVIGAKVVDIVAKKLLKHDIKLSKGFNLF